MNSSATGRGRVATTARIMRNQRIRGQLSCQQPGSHRRRWHLDDLPIRVHAQYWSTTQRHRRWLCKSPISQSSRGTMHRNGVYFAANPRKLHWYPFSDWASAQSYLGIWAGGGGVSNCVSIDVNGVCQSGFPQPSWQAGLNASAINPGGFGVTIHPGPFFARCLADGLHLLAWLSPLHRS